MCPIFPGVQDYPLYSLVFTTTLGDYLWNDQLTSISESIPGVGIYMEMRDLLMVDISPITQGPSFPNIIPNHLFKHFQYLTFGKVYMY